MEVAEEVTLNHNQAVPVLKVISPDKNPVDMSPDKLTALTHYSRCKRCRDIGLDEMLGLNMSHQEAILIWAKNPGALDLAHNKSLQQECAVEHIWGKFEIVPGGGGYNFATGCSHRSCRTLSGFWQNSPISLFYNGEDEVAREFPVILEIFVTEGWPIKELLNIQKRRVKSLIADLEKGEITVSPGHYLSASHLTAELLAHVEALQKLALA